MTPKKALVYDVGANVGDKSGIFSRIGSQVIAFEPDKENFRLLKRRFAFSRRVRVFDLALGSKEGLQEFFINTAGSPANTLSSKWKNILENPDKNRWSKDLKFGQSYMVRVARLQNVIEKYGVPYYLKIDVEGFEFEVVKSLEVPIHMLTLEANFPEFKNEIIDCVKHLIKISDRYKFNCFDGNYRFFWSEHLIGQEFIEWLEKTELRYFEVFCLEE